MKEKSQAKATLEVTAQPHPPGDQAHRALGNRTRLTARIYRALWLGQIHSETPALPKGALVLAAHYNGAVDGFTYGSQMPPFAAVVSAQWHRRAIGRVLMPGISVQRAKDGVSGAHNLTALREILGCLRSGERILFFPEGTSRLGTERLPIQPGTLLMLRLLRRQSPPPVYFVAARYDQPERWRSNVSLAWVGPAPLPEIETQDEAWVASGIASAQAASLRMRPFRRNPLRLLAPLASLPYLIPWTATALLARRTADDSNVVALWKFIFGVPLTLATWILLTGGCVAAGWPWWMPSASLAIGSVLWTQ